MLGAPLDLQRLFRHQPMLPAYVAPPNRIPMISEHFTLKSEVQIECADALGAINPVLRKPRNACRGNGSLRLAGASQSHAVTVHISGGIFHCWASAKRCNEAVSVGVDERKVPSWDGIVHNPLCGNSVVCYFPINRSGPMPKTMKGDGGESWSSGRGFRETICD